MLLHVLAEIRFLRVALAAILTDVGFQMFALFVLRYVLQQRGLVAKALVARIALVRFVRLMASGVGLEVAQLGEGLLATRVSTSGREDGNLIKIVYSKF